MHELTSSGSGPGFTVALSHDVDRVHKSFQSLTHFLKHAGRGRVRDALFQVRSIAQKDNYWCFEKICEIEARREIHSTWFFLNETYPFQPLKIRSWRLSLGYYSLFQARVAHMIRRLDSSGHEIGLHGSYLSYNDRDLLKKEKLDLEAIVGHEVKGIRQHYLNLSPETWKIQKSLGFLYDASFGYRDRAGFKNDAYQPFPLDPQHDFFIVPQAIMDSCLMRQRDPWAHARTIIDVAEKNGAFLVLNWHQQIFDEREYPGYSRMYERILDECLSRGAAFAVLADYIKRMLVPAAEIHS